MREQEESAPWDLYYRIVSDDGIVGGMIVFDKGAGHYELGRIFVEPERQGQGIGTQALEFLWREYPLATRWTLEPSDPALLRAIRVRQDP